MPDALTSEIKRLMMQQFHACMAHDVKKVRSLHSEIETLLNKLDDERSGKAK